MPHERSTAIVGAMSRPRPAASPDRPDPPRDRADPAPASGTALPRDFTGYMVDTDVLLRELATRGVRPAHPVVHSDHVTYRGPGRAPDARTITVVGVAGTDEVDCVVVTVDGTSDRPDGSTFHITLSTAPGVHGRQANAVLASTPVEAIDPFEVPFRRV